MWMFKALQLYSPENWSVTSLKLSLPWPSGEIRKNRPPSLYHCMVGVGNPLAEQDRLNESPLLTVVLRGLVVM